MSATSIPGAMLVSEAAAYLRVHPDTVRRWIRKEGLPACRIGRSIRILDEDLAAWMRRTSSAPGVPSETDTPPAVVSLPPLADRTPGAESTDRTEQHGGSNR